MSNNSLKVMEMVSDYLLDNPDIRFCQALHNMDIIYKDPTFAYIKDNYHDSDEVTMERIKATRII